MGALMTALLPRRRLAAGCPSASSRRWWLVVRFTLAMAITTSAGLSEARGQETERPRAAELEAARRAKAQALEEDRPNKVERALSYIEESKIFTKIFDPPRGWFAQIGGVGEGNGFTLGGGFRQPTPVGVLTLRGLGSFRHSHLASVEFTRTFLPREAGFVSASITRRHEAAQRFYGLGADSTADDQSSFGLSATQADITVGARLLRDLTVRAGATFANPDINASSEASRVPPTDGRFDDTTAPGLAFQPEYVIAHVGLVVDTRNAGNPRRGGLYQAQLRRFGDRQGGQYSFFDTRIDLQQFIPFWNESRVLALRALVHQADGLGQSQVPFYLMPTLGGAKSLRGYDRQRFRDASLILFSAEYRYEVNPFLMGAVFYDTGQVAPDWSVFQAKKFRDNYGVGLRFGYNDAVALRADVAFGGEDTVRFIIGFSTTF